jgi:hypothetical protein
MFIRAIVIIPFQVSGEPVSTYLRRSYIRLCQRFQRLGESHCYTNAKIRKRNKFLGPSDITHHGELWAYSQNLFSFQSY